MEKLESKVDDYIKSKNEQIHALQSKFSKKEIYSKLPQPIKNDVKEDTLRRAINRNVKKIDPSRYINDPSSGYQFKITRTQLFIYYFLKMCDSSYDQLFGDFLNPISETELSHKEPAFEEKVIELLEEIKSISSNAATHPLRKKRTKYFTRLVTVNHILLVYKNDITKELKKAIENCEEFTVESINGLNLIFLSQIQSSYSKSIFRKFIEYMTSKKIYNDRSVFLNIMLSIQIYFLESIYALNKIYPCIKSQEIELLLDQIIDTRTLISNYLKIEYDKTTSIEYTPDECKKAASLCINLIDSIKPLSLHIDFITFLNYSYNKSLTKDRMFKFTIKANKYFETLHIFIEELLDKES